jgi:transcriptional regulator with XRE-family HTH domain
MVNVPMNLKLKAAILKTGKSQCKIAKKAKMYPSRLSNIIYRRVKPRTVEKFRLSKVLHCEMSDIFDEKIDTNLKIDPTDRDDNLEAMYLRQHLHSRCFPT